MTLPADTVIIATGYQPKTLEANELYGITPQTSTVGDCQRIANVLEAVNEGYFLGASIE